MGTAFDQKGELSASWVLEPPRSVVQTVSSSDVEMFSPPRPGPTTGASSRSMGDLELDATLDELPEELFGKKQKKLRQLRPWELLSAPRRW